MLEKSVFFSKNKKDLGAWFGVQKKSKWDNQKSNSKICNLFEVDVLYILSLAKKWMLILEKCIYFWEVEDDVRLIYSQFSSLELKTFGNWEVIN